MKQTKTIQIIHLAFCAAILAFGVVAIMITKDNLFFGLEFKNADPVVFIAHIFALISLVISGLLFNKLIGNIDSNIRSTEKITQYQTAFLVKCAFLEGAALFNIVACLVTNNALTLIFATICLAYLWLSRPTDQKIYETLQMQDPNSF